MKVVKDTFFILGILLSVLAFLLSKADQIPFVYSFVAPSYIEAKRAIETLETKSELLPEMPGFSVCADLYLTGLQKDYPEMDFTGITITRLQRIPKVSQNFGLSKGVTTERPLNVYLSDGNIIESNVEALQKKADRIKTNRILVSSTILFVVGILLTATMYYLERRKSA